MLARIVADEWKMVDIIGDYEIEFQDVTVNSTLCDLIATLTLLCCFIEAQYCDFETNRYVLSSFRRSIRWLVCPFIQSPIWTIFFLYYMFTCGKLCNKVYNEFCNQLCIFLCTCKQLCWSLKSICSSSNLYNPGSHIFEINKKYI